MTTSSLLDPRTTRVDSFLPAHRIHPPCEEAPLSPLSADFEASAELLCGQILDFEKDERGWIAERQRLAKHPHSQAMPA